MVLLKYTVHGIYYMEYSTSTTENDDYFVKRIKKEEGLPK